MKKTLIFILAAVLIFAAGCTKNMTTENKTTNDDQINESENAVDNTKDKIEAIIVTGIIKDIKDGMITLVNVKGLGAENVIVVLTGTETEWLANKDDMVQGLTMTAELSPMMTRSLPPQSPAIRIISLENIVYGQVLEVSDDRMLVKSTNEYGYYDEVVILFDESTQWDIDKDVIKVNMHVEVLPSDVMTMSIPPQTVAVKVLDVK